MGHDLSLPCQHFARNNAGKIRIKISGKLKTSRFLLHDVDEYLRINAIIRKRTDVILICTETKCFTAVMLANSFLKDLSRHLQWQTLFFCTIILMHCISSSIRCGCTSINTILLQKNF